MRRSKAGSMFAARLVAKMTMPGKVSSSCSSTLTTELASRSTAACMTVKRRPAIASASSKKSTASCRSAARNTEATCLAVCPTQRDSSSEYRTTSSLRLSVYASASAQMVLPVPGGPAKWNASPRPVRVPLGEPPLAKDEVVLPDQRQRVVQRPKGPLREHHVVERALRARSPRPARATGGRRRDRGWNRPCGKIGVSPGPRPRYSRARGSLGLGVRGLAAGHPVPRIADGGLDLVPGGRAAALVAGSGPTRS